MTDAYAGHDSPLALAVAIGESRRSMQDHQGGAEHPLTDDELLTNVMLYWVTESWASARRFYWHTARDAPTVPDDGRLPVPVPTGVGAFPADVFYVPRKLVRRDADVTQWDLHRSGGHVAGAEEPTALVDALRRFYRPLR
jgi:hypothetical protein